MSQTRRLSMVLGLNLSMIVGLLVVGLLDRSLGVLAAGVDCLADSAALALGLIAVHLRDRRGRRDAPNWVALINGSALLVMTLVVVVAAVWRLVDGSPRVAGVPMVVVAGCTALVMTAGALILGRGAGAEDVHMRSVLLDTVADAGSSALVAVAGLIIVATGGLFWLDPAAAIVVGVVIIVGAAALIGSVTRSLRHGRSPDAQAVHPD